MKVFLLSTADPILISVKYSHVYIYLKLSNNVKNNELIKKYVGYPNK